MASQTAQTTNRTQPAPRRTTTIGIRLTSAEIAALDAFIVKRPYDGVSRAGMAASIILDVLVEEGLLAPDDAG